LEIYNQVIATSRAVYREEPAMREPLSRASTLRKHVMVGGVEAERDRSLCFHERLGFVRVAHFKEVGFKFGRWLDLLFLQRILETVETDSDAS
jgi:phosphinothricin acetyltransferase